MTTDTLNTVPDTAAENALADPVRTGDPASCDLLIGHFAPPLYRYLYWLTGSREEAITHFKDTILYLYLNPGRVRKEASLRHFLFRRATQTWLQRRTQHQRKRRSSLDNILRAGLQSTAVTPLQNWSGQCDGVDPDRVADVEYVINELRSLGDSERAALLLFTAADIPMDVVAASLRLSSRKAHRLVEGACGQLVQRATGYGGGLPRRVKTLASRHLLQLETPRQAKKFAILRDTEEVLQKLVTEGTNVLAILKSMPQARVPQSLAEETKTHMAKGHAALETRIATWGFRFMQVTLPLFILAILAVILLPAISRSREMARRAAATDNLEMLGKALRTYSDSSPGKRFPALYSAEGLWVPDLEQLYPRYIGDPSILVSPSLNDPNLVATMKEALNATPPDWLLAHRILARSYVYTGYTLIDATALSALIELRRSQPELDLEGDLETAERRIYRLRQGIEQFFVGTAGMLPDDRPTGPVRIPVMFEVFEATGFGGNPEGANVLYLDGTVEYVPFGSAFPVDATVMALLEEYRRRR